ncbi:MAG: hypothetical protein JWN21_447 [Sphingomonas bacterium]|uniref:hypothetical protein n=1 Tax=Sphingomonas bacterium TaxID=1895847 RepID=UPI00261D87EF|nr:hypothetical protein [Sphingomonas bacterium]MDB5694904.1 hypothetical protein [Sphingomonas bacterium]
MSVDQAQATLTRAASFWADRSDSWGAWDEPGGDVRARYTANCLRELDGFLRNLLDEIQPASNRRQRNTANKLGRMPLRGGHVAADAPRLRAIGRSAGCLFHCGGWVRRPDETAGRWMTAGWPEAHGRALRRYSLGDRLRPGPREVADMCGFFVRVGDAVAR